MKIYLNLELVSTSVWIDSAMTSKRIYKNLKIKQNKNELD